MAELHLGQRNVCVWTSGAVVLELGSKRLFVPKPVSRVCSLKDVMIVAVFLSADSIALMGVCKREQRTAKTSI